MLEELGGNPLSTESQRARVLQWAKDGHAGSQVVIGRGYNLGENLPKDIKQSMHWYQLAANQGDVQAYSALAHLYMGYDDKSVRNVPMALHWLRKAADQGAQISDYAIFNIKAKITPQLRYRYNADDLEWLDTYFSRESAGSPSSDAGQAQCRAEAAKFVTECAKVTGSCDIIGCSDEIICDSNKGGCEDHDSPYGRRGIFYCDTRNWRNRDVNRDVVLADACPVGQ